MTTPSRDSPGTPTDRRRATTYRALEHVREALSDLRHGEITLVVQDGVVVQVERTVKTRMPNQS